MTALLCTLFDLVLITVGVGGLGAVIAANQRLLTATTLGGSAFLLGYGVRALRSAWSPPPTAAAAERPATDCFSLKGTLLATVSFSFLNPATYIDTVLMIGTASSRFPVDERFVFGAGALAGRLRPLVFHLDLWFQPADATAAPLLCLAPLDLVSGCLMVGLAGSLWVTHPLRFW
ncbi:MAG: LysE family transporter [Caldilineaceae bacterium]